jgi:chemotaxis-related protein WspB
VLLLLVSLGDARYGLDARQVVEVVPAVALRALPHAAPGVAGLLAHRDGTLPVIDLVALATGRPSAPRLGTRVVLVRWPPPDGVRLLGLVAEAVTDTALVADDAWEPPVVATPGAPWLGGTTSIDGELVQRLRLDAVLPDALARQLFPGEAEA